jgi:Calcineurin-like phosphoesterase
MRTLFIGDVHGCAEELDLLLAECAWRPGDRVVLVGDLVAKGPDSAGVVRRARERGFLAVRGNHDAHVLRWRAGRMPEDKKPKPEHQQVLDTLEDADWAYLESLPLHRHFPELNVRVVHAGLVPGVPLEEQRPELLLNLRSITPKGKPSKRWTMECPGRACGRGRSSSSSATTRCAGCSATPTPSAWTRGASTASTSPPMSCPRPASTR